MSDRLPTPSDLRPLSRRARRAWLGVAVAVTGLALWHGSAINVGPRATMRVTNVSRAAEVARSVASASWVVGEGVTPSVHGSSVCALPDGELATIWYGGEREGAADVAIYLSRRSAGPQGSWSAPERLLGPEDAESDTGRNVRKLGNAVMFSDHEGRLWLVYVSVSVGGWSGSLLNVKRSDDGGRSWSTSQRLTLSPFLNFSTLVRAKPFFTSDGWIGLPVYHEFVAKYPQILWIEPGDDMPVDRFHLRRLPIVEGLLQPAVVALDERRAVMWLRDGGGDRTLHMARSDDAGWSWTKPVPTNLPNPDAGIDAIRLHDGRIVLAYNDTREDRRRLRLAVSRDDGATWVPGTVLDEADHGEFSYPSLVQDAHGVIHVTYTWQRLRIKHVQLTADQLAPGANLLASLP
jgi:predicted neuraminidase